MNCLEPKRFLHIAKAISQYFIISIAFFNFTISSVYSQSVLEQQDIISIPEYIDRLDSMRERLELWRRVQNALAENCYQNKPEFKDTDNAAPNKNNTNRGNTPPIFVPVPITIPFTQAEWELYLAFEFERTFSLYGLIDAHRNYKQDINAASRRITYSLNELRFSLRRQLDSDRTIISNVIEKIAEYRSKFPKRGIEEATFSARLEIKGRHCRNSSEIDKALARYQAVISLVQMSLCLAHASKSDPDSQRVVQSSFANTEYIVLFILNEHLIENRDALSKVAIDNKDCFQKSGFFKYPAPPDMWVREKIE